MDGFERDGEGDSLTGGAGARQEVERLRKQLGYFKVGLCVAAGLLLLLVALLAGRGGAAPPASAAGTPPPSGGPTAPLQPHDAQRLILISMDGFRHDYLDRPELLLPSMRALAADGLRATRLQPVWPSVTFPNHYSIVTGLYPAWHGIVLNGFSYGGDRFSMRSKELKWWIGEPLWATAQLAGKRAATIFWPGSETARPGWPACAPPYCLPYDGSLPNAERVDHALALLRGPDPPDLITLYFSDTDDMGHKFGPESPQVNDAVTALDAAVGRLVAGLRDAGLFDSTHVVMLGDHGMAAVCSSKRVSVDALIAAAPKGSALAAMTPQNFTATGTYFWLPIADGSRVSAVQLAADVNAAAAAMGAGELLQAWPKGRLPERLGGYGASDRVADVVGTVALGYTLSPDSADASACRCGGAHGFDNALDAMGSFMLAHGPRFARGVTLSTAWTPNVELYAAFADILGIEPRPNNGTPGFAATLLLPAAPDAGRRR